MPSVFESEWYKHQRDIAEQQNEEHLRRNRRKFTGKFLKFFGLRKADDGTLTPAEYEREAMAGNHCRY